MAKSDELQTKSPGLLKLGSLMRPYWWRLALVLFLLIGLAGVNIVIPLLVGTVLNRVFPENNWPLLWLVLGAFFLVYVLRNVLYFFSKYTAVSVGENVCFTLRSRLFETLQQMNLRYYRDTSPGQLSSRVMNDSYMIQEFIQGQLPKVMQAFLLFLGIVATMYALNWQLAVASTIVLPLHFFTFNYFKGPIKQASKTAQAHMADATGNLIEKFLGMEVVKSFTAEDREQKAFQDAIDQSRQSQLRGKKFHVMQKVMADLLIGLGTIFLFGFGAYQVMGPTAGQRLQAGDFIAFFWYVKMLFPTVLELTNGLAKLLRASAGIDRVFEVLEPESGQETSRTRAHPAFRGELEFDGVSFSYPDSPPVLQDVSFRVKAGQVCAIVGPSGCGKSTLVSMVPRFNEAQTGTVRVDGVDVRDVDLRHLRKAIGIAFQECFLFNSTVLENLRYAKPEATRSEIMEIARRTGAHDFISHLARGYDTLLGEDGVTLSRGQKQQITLTRAMLKDPQILILDEATASLDEAREAQIIPAILEFMEGKTTLMVTHRSELMKHADIILHLEGGRVVCYGPPSESELAAAETSHNYTVHRQTGT